MAPSIAMAADAAETDSGVCETCVDRINAAEKTGRLSPLTDPFPPARAQFSKKPADAYENANAEWNRLSGTNQAAFIFNQFKYLVRAHNYKLKPSLLVCLAWMETANDVSGSMKFNPWSKSSTGAIGAGQTLRSTVGDLFSRYRFRSVVQFPAGAGGVKYSQITDGKVFADKSVHSLVAQLELIVGVSEMKRRDGGDGDYEIAYHYYAGPGAKTYASRAINCMKDIDANGLSISALRKAR